MTRGRWIAVAVVLALVVVGDFIVPKEAYGPFWSYRGFFSWFAFVGCVAIVVISKWLGKLLLQQGEDYYQKDENHA